MQRTVVTKTLMGGGLVAIVALAGAAHAAAGAPHATAPAATAPATNAPAPVRAATLAEAAFDESTGDAYRVSSADDPTGVHDLVETSLRTIHDHEEHPDD